MGDLFLYLRRESKKSALNYKFMKKVIFINAGHHLADPGAIYGSNKESDEVMKIRDLLVPMLEKYFEVHAVPDNLNLNDSIKWVNGKIFSTNDGLAVDIHLNSSVEGSIPGTGAEALYYGWLSSSKSIAKKLLDKYCEVTGYENRGVLSEKQTRFGVNGWVHNTNCWATLIECCFIDNPKDMAKLQSNYGLVAKGIYEGILNIYDIKEKEEIKKKANDYLLLAMDLINRL